MVVKVKKDDLYNLIDALLEHNKVVGVKRKESEYIFDTLHTGSEFCTEYVPSILPVKKFFFPAKETILNYNKESDTYSMPDGKPSNRNTIYFGVRACDYEALLMLDSAFLDENPDAYYRQKRDKSVFVVMNCCEHADDNCFCDLVSKPGFNKSPDVYAIDCEDHYLFEINSKNAVDLFDAAKDFFEVIEFEIDYDKFSLKKNCALLDRKDVLLNEENILTAIGKDSENCLECGNCFMVCPTCYCFTLYDSDEADMKKGERIRKWDGCVMQDFTLVAGGKSMVATNEERLMHRFNRKYKNALTEQGKFLCVGCGRCIRACPAGNSVKKTLNSLLSEGYCDE